VKKRKKRRQIPEEIDKIGPYSLKVTIRPTDRGDTVEDADLYDENFGGFGLAREDRGDFLGGRPGCGPKGWAGVQPSGPPPFVQQAIRAAEKLRGPDLGAPDRVDGILGEEKLPLLAQHTERRIQALYCRRHRSSAALEAKRFPRLPALDEKIFPKETRRQPATERRPKLNLLVADYLARGGEITFCPPEMTTAQLKNRKTKTKMGRPPIFGKAMSQAQRKRRSRAKWKQPTPAAPLQLAKCPAPRLVPARAVGAGFLIKDEA
jgi:hypothetical protein